MRKSPKKSRSQKSLKASAVTPPASVPVGEWWRQPTGITWSGFEEAKERKWPGFFEDVGTTLCDRGIHYGYGKRPDSKADVVKWHQDRGLKVTAFITRVGWKPEKAYLDDLIAFMNKILDDGCDGIHIDMFADVDDPVKNVQKSDAAARAVARLRDAVHERNPKAIFTGNAWLLERTLGPCIVKICDVGWIESYGHDDLDLVRSSRVARSLDGYTKPVWYHWQPDDDEGDRVDNLGNLSRALYSSCLMEGVVFLCNYRYPVPVLSWDKEGTKSLAWTWYPINDRWKREVVKYARFAREHADLYRNVRPDAPVLLAYNPQQIGYADKNMTLLLKNNISFNVHLFGEWPFEDFSRCRDVGRYKCLLNPDNGSERKVIHPKVKLAAGDIMAADIPGIHDFCRVEGASNVVTRVFTQPGRRLVHMKQWGYTDQADALPPIGPLKLEVHCPERVLGAVCLSPDRARSMKLKFSQRAGQVRMTVPELEYYNLIVLETRR